MHISKKNSRFAAATKAYVFITIQHYIRFQLSYHSPTLLQFLDNVIIIQTKVLHPQA